jgi:hypothetical protein
VIYEIQYIRRTSYLRYQCACMVDWEVSHDEIAINDKTPTYEQSGSFLFNKYNVVYQDPDHISTRINFPWH